MDEVENEMWWAKRDNQFHVREPSQNEEMSE